MKMKTAVANWVNVMSPQPNPLLDPRTRTSRGLQHDITGRLLCPINFNWDDLKWVQSLLAVHRLIFERVRAKVRAFHPEYDYASSFFIRCLYANEQGDIQNIEKGFLKSALLVNVNPVPFLSMYLIDSSYIFTGLQIYLHLPIVNNRPSSGGGREWRRKPTATSAGHVIQEITSQRCRNGIAHERAGDSSFDRIRCSAGKGQLHILNRCSSSTSSARLCVVGCHSVGSSTPRVWLPLLLLLYHWLLRGYVWTYRAEESPGAP